MTTMPQPAHPATDPVAAAERRLTSQFILTGVALLGLFIAFIVLFTNFPAGYDAPPGLSLESVALFGGLWPYPSLAFSPDAFAIASRLVIVLLFAVYIGSEAIVRRCAGLWARRRLIALILGFALLFTTLMAVVMPPILSSDIFLYALIGRLVAVYHLNPYSVTAMAVSADNLFPHVFWRDVTAYYGPTWTLISAGTAALAGQSVLVTTIAFKVVTGIFHMVNCVLVFFLARRLGGKDGLSAMLLYAWNPLILIETVGSGHNDGVMLAFALAGLLLLTANRRLRGVALLVASVLVKYLTAVLLLFAVVVMLVRQKTWQAAARLAMHLAAAGAVVAGLLLLPFVSSTQALQQLVSAGSALRAVVPNPLRLAMRNGLATAMSGRSPTTESKLAAESVLMAGLNAIFVLIIVYTIVRLVSSHSDLAQAVEVWGVLSLVYVIFIYGGIFPWYMVTTLTIPLVARDNKTNQLLLLTSVGLGIFMMLFYTIPTIPTRPAG